MSAGPQPGPEERPVPSPSDSSDLSDFANTSAPIRARIAAAVERA
jgi:hypothetical protein